MDTYMVLEGALFNTYYYWQYGESIMGKAGRTTLKSNNELFKTLVVI